MPQDIEITDINKTQNHIIEEQEQEIIKLPLEQFIDYLEENIIGTQILIDGYEVADRTTVYEGIILSSILRLRHAISVSIKWLENNISNNEENNEENNNTDNNLEL